jgi:hypothetical protein
MPSNDRETNNETTAFVGQLPAHQWSGWKAVISAGSAPLDQHVTVEATMMSYVFYAIRAEGL